MLSTLMKPQCNAIQQCEKNLYRLQSSLTDLLNLSRIPDQSPLIRRADQAILSLFDVLDELNRKKIRNLKDRGPLVYAIPGRDPLDWPTSDNQQIRDILPGSLTKLKGLKSTDFGNQRIYTYLEFLEKCEQVAHPENPFPFRALERIHRT